MKDSIILLLCLFSFSGCYEWFHPPENPTIVFKNQSDRDVYVNYIENDYRNDSLHNHRDVFRAMKWSCVRVKTGKTYEFSEASDMHVIDYRDEFAYMEREGKGNRIYFYVVDAALLDSVGLDSITEDYNILARYGFTIDDMDRLDWSFCYPPDESMKDVHMYPSYEEQTGASLETTGY